VKRLELSGFVGFDFILDCANRAWLLEMNPRVTPICHFLLADGTNLAGSLYAQMMGRPPLSRLAPVNRDLIALFPSEIIRCPSSNYLRSCQHDVPWDEPELVRGVLNRVLRTSVLGRTRALFEAYFPGFIGALVRLGLLGANGKTLKPQYEVVVRQDNCDQTYIVEHSAAIVDLHSGCESSSGLSLDPTAEATAPATDASPVALSR